ncbi:MAG: hypothetical protein ACHQRM_17595 [Bacteroidia bacterium]
MIFHKKGLILMISMLLGICFLSKAQDEAYVPKPRPVHHDHPKKDILDKLYFGGNIGLDFPYNGFYVETSPFIGYKVSDKFSAGVSITYIHYDFKFPFPYGEVRNEIYGGGVFGRYLIMENIFLQAETKFINGYWQDGERSSIYPVLVGVGYRSRIGSRGSTFISALYDLNYDALHSPYPYPWIFNFGFGYGF